MKTGRTQKPRESVIIIMDTLTVIHLGNELNKTLNGTIITKVLPQDQWRFAIKCQKYKNPINLYISLVPNSGFTAISSSPPPETGFTPPFGLLARKYLERSRIETVKHIHGERILEFTLSSQLPYPETSSLYMILEFLGRQNNFFLLNKNKNLLGSYKQLQSLDEQVERLLLPGAPYNLPPAHHKPMLLQISCDQLTLFFKNAVIEKPDLPVIKWFSNNFTGLNLLHLEALLQASGIQIDTTLNTMHESQINNLFQIIQEICKNHQTLSLIYNKDGKILGHSLLNMSEYYNAKLYPTVSTLLLAVLEQKNSSNIFDLFKNRLARQVATLLSKHCKKVERQELEFEDTNNASHYKSCGDMILAYISLITKGSTSLELPEYNMTIRINPAFSPQENARQYYKKYQKAKSGKLKITQELAKTRDNINFLERLLVFIDGAEKYEELQQIETELIEAKLIYLPKKLKPKKTTKDTLVYIKSPDGFDVIVGKNHRDNEFIYRHIAKSNDLWFHASKIPGSHVLIKSKENENIPQVSIEFAAQLAAFYSKGKNESYVDVDYTARKYVSKIAGAKPGMVIYNNFKTIRVPPKQ